MQISKVPGNIMVSFDKIVNLFNIDNLTRNHNTNTFIGNSKWIKNEVDSDDVLITGLVIGKYIDIIPIQFEDILIESNNWIIKRHCPTLDLFVDKNDKIDISLDLFNWNKYEEGIKNLSAFNDLDSTNNLNERLSVAYLNKNVIEKIYEKTNGNGFPLYMYCNPKNDEIHSWIMVGLRLLTIYDPEKHDVDVVFKQ